MKKLLKPALVLVSVLLGLSIPSIWFAKSYYESRLTPEIHIEEALDVTDLSQITERHKGSLLYVDHMSVNCGSCFIEMEKYVPQLQQRYKNKPITFVYICSESNYPLKTVSNAVLWRRKLAAAKVSGQHYLVSKEFSMKLFKQTVNEAKGEIPYYPWPFIIDKTGKVINSHAESPTQLPQLYQQLDSLLSAS